MANEIQGIDYETDPEPTGKPMLQTDNLTAAQPQRIITAQSISSQEELLERSDNGKHVFLAPAGKRATL